MKKFMKRIISIILVAICIVPKNVNMTYAYAALNVPSYLFDALYYYNMYDDVRIEYGMDPEALYHHWINCGMAEGRSPSYVYRPDYYLNENPDLRAAFGNDYVALYEHWKTHGIYEFRPSSEIYDGSFYKNNTDLQNTFGNSSEKYLDHFLTWGMKEGRQGNSSCNILAYKSNYEDLRNSFGDDMQSYYLHYIKYGIYENRDATGTTIPTSPTNTTITNSTPNLIVSNLPNVKLIRQGSKTCKATAVAQSLNIIVGSNKYTTGSFGNSSCTNINGRTYQGSDGNTYVATYKTDAYKGSRAEQQEQIDRALSVGLPIIVTVHKTTSGTKHHWVTIIGAIGNTYKIIDPATGIIRTMSDAKYDFGLTNYSNGAHYGYISFTKR